MRISMSKVAAICLLLGLAATGLAAADTILENPFVPASPEVMAQGGSFVANAEGYNALFYNPAGFAFTDRSLTFLSTSAWLYSNPVRFASALRDADPAALVGFIEDQVTTGGFGFGLSEGIAWVGKGFGLGLVLNVDSYLYGETILGTEGELDATIGLVGGYAYPFKIGGMTLAVGAALRPMIRVHTEVDFDTVVGLMMGLETEGGDPLAALNSATALHGFGLGIDLGAILEMGGLRVAVSARDVPGTWFAYKESTFGEIVGTSGSFGLLKVGTKPEDSYMIPLNLSLGASYHFDLGSVSRYVDPTVHVSLEDFIGVIRDKRSIWTLLHAGAEVKLVRVINVRAGINQGYLTAGLGLDLWILDLNVAMFTREMGVHLGDRPNSGVTAEVALRL